MSDTLKTEVLQIAAMEFGYVVPKGFVDEPLSTHLHGVLRVLRDENAITRCDGAAGHETWCVDAPTV